MPPRLLVSNTSTPSLPPNNLPRLIHHTTPPHARTPACPHAMLPPAPFRACVGAPPSLSLWLPAAAATSPPTHAARCPLPGAQPTCLHAASVSAGLLLQAKWAPPRLLASWPSPSHHVPAVQSRTPAASFRSRPTCCCPTLTYSFFCPIFTHLLPPYPPLCIPRPPPPPPAFRAEPAGCSGARVCVVGACVVVVCNVRLWQRQRLLQVAATTERTAVPRRHLARAAAGARPEALAGGVAGAWVREAARLAAVQALGYSRCEEWRGGRGEAGIGAGGWRRRCGVGWRRGGGGGGRGHICRRRARGCLLLQPAVTHTVHPTAPIVIVPAAENGTGKTDHHYHHHHHHKHTHHHEHERECVAPACQRLRRRAWRAERGRPRCWQ